jgi:Uma2 family endonuclease
MGTRAALSVEEYLHTSFPDLDKEYRDGKLVERTLPDYLHGKIQGLLYAFFLAFKKSKRTFPCVETRMMIGPDLIRIPDVAVFHPDEPADRFPDTPPLVAIEVLSRDDRRPSVLEKLEEYCAWGVKHVWLVDPYAKRLYTCDPALTEVPTLRISELGLEVTPADLFES